MVIEEDPEKTGIYYPSNNQQDLQLQDTSTITTPSTYLEDDDESFFNSLPIHQQATRRMRRTMFRLISRRNIVIITSIVFFCLLVFRNQNGITASTSWHTTSIFDCPSNRTNPFGIAPPPPADALALTKLWSNLKTLFHANPPVPGKLEKPKHDGSKFPKKEKLGSFFALSNEDAEATRRHHKQVIDGLPEYPASNFAGRGIVMLAGGRYSEFAATSLGMVREMQSKLPVELWIRDEDEDMPGWCEELAQEGIACRRISDYMETSDLKHAYAFKVFTILFSSFKEILFLDADSCPIVNPDQVFTSKIYKESGAVLWPDYWTHSGSPWLPYLIGVSSAQSEMFMDEKSVESGQIIWNKERHWKSLLLAVYYNYYGPDFWYTVLNNGWAGWGDKDTFPIALKATGESYFQVKHGIVTTFISGTQRGIGMVQANPENTAEHEPMFLHSNIIKWSMRNLACFNCDDLPNHTPYHYHLEDNKSDIHNHLIEGRRIFSMSQMDEKNIDPEPIMWKAVEHTACKSAAWGNDQVCTQTRGYMEKALGYEFRKSRIASAVGNGNQYCLIQPEAFKRPPKES